MNRVVVVPTHVTTIRDFKIAFLRLSILYKDSCTFLKNTIWQILKKAFKGINTSPTFTSQLYLGNSENSRGYGWAEEKKRERSSEESDEEELPCWGNCGYHSPSFSRIAYRNDELGGFPCTDKQLISPFLDLLQALSFGHGPSFSPRSYGVYSGYFF